MKFYTVKQGGERLDRIAKNIFGSERKGTVEALLNFNQNLSVLSAFVPEGTIIRIPDDVVTGVEDRFVQVWE